MGDNTLSIKITADVVDLQTKFVTAKAEVSALTKQMNDLAKQSAAGILDPAGLAQLQDVSRQFLEAKAAAAELSAELKGTHESSVSLGEGFAEIRGQITTAFEAGGILLAYEAIKQVVEVVGEFGERAIKIRSMSEVLSLTTDQFQAFSLAGEEAGVSAETLTRAGERLETVLNEARDGSGAAVEKLRLLGVATEQVSDPTFKLNDLLGVLRDRLSNTATEEETRNELLKILGSRTAIAIAALKEYDGSAASVARVMRELNGLSTEEIKQLAESKAAFDRLGTTLENTAGKYLAMAEASKSGGGTDAVSRIEALTGNTPKAAPKAESGTEVEDARIAARLKGAQAEIAAIQLVTLADLQSDKDAIAATKQGSAERLAAVQQFALEAAVYYGPNVDKVREANRQVIAEARASNDELIREATKTSNQQKTDLQKLSDFAEALDTKAIAEHARTLGALNALDIKQVTEREKQLQDLSNYAEQLDLRVTREHTQAVAQMTRINAKETQDQLAQWQHMATSMQSSFSNAISGMVHGTETFGEAGRSILSSMVDDLIQMFVQMGIQWIETSLLNATTTRTTAEANIAAHAGEAGAAGVASWAGAPWPIDLGAPAFGASMALEAGSFAVAEHGYDVPAGLNPITMLHAKEMVLPRAQADVIRGLANQGPGGGLGGGSRTVHIHGKPGSVFTQDQLVGMLKDLGHQFKLA